MSGGRLGAGASPEGCAATAIELAKASDAASLASMSRRLIEQGLDWRWRAASIAREIRHPESAVPLLRDRDSIAGFAAVRFDFDAHRAHLLLLAVEPKQRRKGIAAALIEWGVAIARNGGVQELTLEVRARSGAARALYAQCGFRVVERLRGYYQGREDALRMQRVLAGVGYRHGRGGHPGMARGGQGFDPFQL